MDAETADQASEEWVPPRIRERRLAATTEPSAAPAGSAERLAAYIERARRGLPLFNPRDSQPDD